MLRVLTCLLLFATGFGPAAAGPPDWLIERHEQRESLIGVERVEIANAIGDLRVRSGDAGQLALFWVSQRPGQGADEPRLQIERAGDLLQVVLRFPGSTTSSTRTGQPQPRADLTVFVPQTLNLALATDQGLLESTGHRGPIAARTGAGAIRITTSGPVKAESRNGEIHVTYKNRQFSGVSEFSTQEGSVHLAFLQDPDLRIHIETDGTITTDYSLNIRPQPGGVRKWAEVDIGAAPRTEIRINSSKGDVRLTRIPDMLRAE